MASTFAGKYVGVADAGPGGAATLAPVLVNVHGGGIATLYTDRGKGTVGPNPVLSDLTARYAIFVDPGVYDIVVRGNTSVVTIQPDSAEYGSGMPPGGAVGQSAIKLSAADYDVGWGTGPSAGVIPLTFTALLTADTTLAANTYGLFDCSGGNRTATLPTAPPDGTRQGLKLSKGVAIASTAVNGSLTTVTLSSAPATALTTGMTVPISGGTGAGATAANGTWPITVLTTTTFTIPVVTTGAGTGGTATAFTLSAVCGGSDTIDLPGGATSAVVARVLNQAIIFQYKSSATSWVVVSSDLPLGQLDLRFAPAGTSVQNGLVTAKGSLLVATASGVVAELAVGANTQVLTADSTQAAGVKWGATAALGNTTPNRLGVAAPGTAITALRSDAVFPVPIVCANLVCLAPSASGYYTWPHGRGSGAGDNTQGRLWMVPICLDRAATIGLGLYVQTAGSAGAVARFGIYADLSGLPGALLVDFGAVSGTVAMTANGVQISPGSYAASPGVRYWVCWVQQGTPTTGPALWSFETGIGCRVPNAGDPLGKVAVYPNLNVSGALPANMPAIGQMLAGQPSASFCIVPV